MNPGRWCPYIIGREVWDVGETARAMQPNSLPPTNVGKYSVVLKCVREPPSYIRRGAPLKSLLLLLLVEVVVVVVVVVAVVVDSR